MITRLEVIDDLGRFYVKGPMYGHDVEVTYALQDDGRTLKVFVHDRTRDKVETESFRQDTEDGNAFFDMEDDS